MDRRRIRFIERDYIFSRVKNATEFLSDSDIDRLLDQHNWCDYTFIFDIQTDRVKTIIIDNDTGCDVALADLNFNANEFYQYQIHILQSKPAIERIRNMLKRRAV